MRILVFGGTVFLGRAVVDAALERGHEVTTFTRGRSGEPRDGATVLHGDRTSAADLAVALAGRTFDAVIDTSAREPGPVEAGARLLDAAASYVLVSSVNAYRGWPPGPIPDESAPTWTDGEGYGPGKAASERVLAALRPGRVLSARAGLIVGPHDDVGRVPWWLRRIAAGGRVVAPGDPDLPIALVDVRDIAGWLVTAAERGWSGPVNASGSVGHVTMGGFLEACRSACASDAELVWAPDDVLTAHEVVPWQEMPLWVPFAECPDLWNVGTARARSLGLPSRPVAETVADTWSWLRTVDAIPIKEGYEMPGLPPAKERAILAALDGA